MNKNKYCKIFYCADCGDMICCTTCDKRDRCGNPCLNDPSRCGIEDTTRQMQEDWRVRCQKGELT